MNTVEELAETRLLAEMRALISFCEVTDNAYLRSIVKQRLKVLSGIGSENDWGIERETSDEFIKDYSHRFTDTQLTMINDYFENPEQSLNTIGTKFGFTANVSAHFVSRFFKFSAAERQLILNKFKKI